MRDLIITRFARWAEDRLPPTVTPGEALAQATADSMDPEAIEVLERLPDRRYERFELIHVVQENLTLEIGRASQTMRGFGGSS